MSNLSNSLILLIVAIVLLWLAVTDKLSRVLDAYDVVVGNASVNATSTTVASLGATSFTLPSLPQLGTNAQVPAV